MTFHSKTFKAVLMGSLSVQRMRELKREASERGFSHFSIDPSGFTVYAEPDEDTTLRDFVIFLAQLLGDEAVEYVGQVEELTIYEPDFDFEEQ